MSLTELKYCIRIYILFNDVYFDVAMRLSKWIRHQIIKLSHVILFKKTIVWLKKSTLVHSSGRIAENKLEQI